ncbi:Migration and invasion enhancer 1 [Branchiostoma belcheri]|nr:Migration and invasion enhancer 1 [Branchiostoma belcheri]
MATTTGGKKKSATVSVRFPRRFRDLARQLRQAFPGSEVVGKIISKPGAFEVYVNKKLYYSMLEKRQFPHINQLVREIKKHLSEAKAPTADLNSSEALPTVTTKQLSPA